MRKYAETIANELNLQIMIIDAAGGIGCRIIAFISGSDYLIAATEAAPSAFHDLKRSIFMGRNSRIPVGIINKFNPAKDFCKKIEKYAKEEKIDIIEYVHHYKNFITASIKLAPVSDLFFQYRYIMKKNS